MAKQLPKQLVDALAWMRSNAIAATFCALVVVVPLGAYFAADWFGSGVRAEADRKVKAYSSLASTLNAKVELPIPGGDPLPLASLPTAETVEEYRQLLRELGGDADAVYDEARAFNAGKGVDSKKPVVEAGVFPNYNLARIDTVRTPFYRAVQKAYADLLASARAGSPPDAAALVTVVQAAEKRFVQGELKQQDRTKLEPEQVKRLDDALGKARLGRCLDAAKQLSFYCDLSAFALPGDAEIQQLYKKKEDRAKHDSFLFDLQWKLWIAADVVSAIADANAGASVLQAPVKRLVRVAVQPVEAVAAAPSGEAAPMGEAPADGGTPAEGAPAEGAVAQAEAPKGLGKPVIDVRADAPRDFSKRLTGRVSNGVYDVRFAEVTFVAETARLPLVFNALAAQNFMTVTNVRIAPADPFAAARSGFIYGNAPVSEVTATLETVWLREFTAPSMPEAVRTALGIQSEAPGAASDAVGGDAAASGE